MPVSMPVRETVAQQNPVEVPLYTPLDVARYLRVSPWLALTFIERERMPPHPEWLLHHSWGRMRPPFLFLDDAPAFPDLPAGPHSCC